MTSAKFFQYAYLVFGLLFAFDGVTKWSVNRNSAYLSLGLAALAVFMFFFKKRFNKKFNNKDTSK